MAKLVRLDIDLAMLARVRALAALRFGGDATACVDYLLELHERRSGRLDPDAIGIDVGGHIVSGVAVGSKHG